jgi:hypothetical protein
LTCWNTRYSGPYCDRRKFAAGRTAHRKDDLVQVAGQGFQPLAVLRFGRRQERTQMQLSGRRMGIQRSRHLMLLKDLLRPHQKILQGFRRDGDVFDER